MRLSDKKYVIGLLTMVVATLAMPAHAQSSIVKEHHNYSEWTKGLFSEAVVVKGFGDGRLIYLGGIGAEEEDGKPGDIRAVNDAAGQCVYIFEKVDRVLKHNDAGPQDIVKMTSYLTSPDHFGAYIQCRNAYFKKTGAKLPAETLLIVDRLAWPEMLLEIDIDAVAE